MQQITLEVTLRFSFFSAFANLVISITPYISFFRFFWKDSRVSVQEGVLKGTEEYLVLVKNEDYDKLWLPDIFIDQAIDIRCCVFLHCEKKTFE